MNQIIKALPWAVAMILLAIGKRYGIVDAKAADTMFIVLPILALLSVIRRDRRRNETAS